MSGLHVVVVGAGIVGLSCADELVLGGHNVTVVDPAPAGGATHAAAGMLAPAGEAWFGDEPLLQLGLDSAARWPVFAASLESRSGCDVGLRRTGTLLVGLDHDDVTRTRRTATVLAEHQVGAELLDGRALRRREPTLSSHVCGGVHLPHDHQVNPRRVAAALLTLLGAQVHRLRAVGCGDGVVRLEDGTHLPADVVVRAVGAATLGERHVRRVRGEVVRVRCDDPPAHVVRAWVHGEPVYLVPRAGGEVVVGATEEEHGRSPDAPRPTVAGVARLLDAARTLLPGLDTADVLEVLARDRPGTPDNGPMIGPVAAEGLATGSGAAPRVVLAVGHHRSGVLLAPVTAAAVRAYVEGGVVPSTVLPFTPDRFDRER